MNREWITGFRWVDPGEEISVREDALNTAIKGWPKTMRQRDRLAEMVEDYRDTSVRLFVMGCALMVALIVAIIT